MTKYMIIVPILFPIITGAILPLFRFTERKNCFSTHLTLINT